MRKGAAVVVGVVGSAAAAIVVGTLLWKQSTARAVARLARLAGSAPGSGTEVFSPDMLAGIPEPVARYFTFALTPGQLPVRRATVAHAGEFRTGGPEAGWRPFSSIEHFTADPPGFVWDAAIRIAPLTTVHVRDSYIAGIGAMQAKLASVISVVDQSGRPELAAGALHRYMAEAVWFPTALLPSEKVAWEPIDDHTARATLTDGGISVSLEFEFNVRGEIISAYTSTRYRDVDGVAVPTPWKCIYRSYVQIEGVMVPMDGEVKWVFPEGDLPYWRGRITRIAYGHGVEGDAAPSD